MDSYKCDVCEWVYNPEEGYPEGGIAPGTPFEELQQSREVALDRPGRRPCVPRPLGTTATKGGRIGLPFPVFYGTTRGAPFFAP